VAARLGPAEQRAAAAWDASLRAWITEEELVLPLYYATLEVAVLQIRKDGKEKVIDTASVDVEDLRPMPGNRNSLSLNFESSKGAQVTFLLCVLRDEPISGGALLTALARPLTECLLLRCCLAALCCCCCCCCAGRRRAATRRPGGAGPPAQGGLPGSTWRGVLRLVSLLFVATAACEVVCLLVWGRAAEKQRMAASVKLFIQAKLLGWLVTEPGALAWTYCTMRSCCPRLLPQQGLEDAGRPPVVLVGEPVVLLEQPLAAPLLQEGGGPKKCVLQ